MIYKELSKTPKQRTFKISWFGQINFTAKGLEYLLKRTYQDYDILDKTILESVKVEGIKNNEER